jgi:integrase/recombinase XerD
MDSIIEEWLSAYDSTETKLSYRYDIERLRSWLSANNITFKYIAIKDLQRFGRTVGKSPADRRLASAIKSFLKYCYNQGYIPTDVGRCLKVPRRTEVRVERKLSKEEVLRMLSLARGSDRLLLKLLFYLGLRLSEARRLQRSDIKSVNGELQFSVLGKGGKFRRVTLSKKLSREIVEHLPSTGYLFRGRNSGCLSRSQTYRRVKKIAKMVHSKASPHWLRHAFCWLALKSGASIVNVSKAMGHSSVSVTSSYAHSSGPPISSFLE